jgi:hypothetical protein
VQARQLYGHSKFGLFQYVLMPFAAALLTTSQALPKFESYRCYRNSLNFLTKVSNAYEQFHGIGRLATFRRKISDFWIVADEVRKARPAGLAAGVI